MQDMKFHPGRILMTPGPVVAIANSGQLPSEFLLRHVAGDWESMGTVDEKENNRALETGLRILSSYETIKCERLWIITDGVSVSEGANPKVRELTTIMLPEEY